MAKIVILDDQPEICTSIRRRLAKDGHDVRTSYAGDEAIDFGHLFEPDLLITDWRLGSEYDGLEVADAFRFANSNVKTILITGHSRHEIEEQESSIEFHSILYKPFSLDEMVAAVNEALDNEALGEEVAGVSAS
jgi:DNA-binding NtrC family response regulator